MKTHRVVMIGLDACDPALAQRFAAEGVMPNLARLLKTAARAPVDNPYGLFVGSLWVSFATALRPDRHSFYCWDKIDLATYEYTGSPPEIDHLPQFWTGISDAGRRVAVIDVPHMIANKALNGFQVVEWGCHDKHHGFHASPPELAPALEAEFGMHAALKGSGDPYAPKHFAPDDEVHREGQFRTADEECALLRDLLDGAREKRRMVAALLDREPSDFFLAIYGESHGVGHQQWHLHDPSHPRHDPATVAAMGGDPLAQVYAELDLAIGEAEAAAGPDSLFVVHFSHGMGSHFDATHLLEEVLVRLDRADGAEPPGQPAAAATARSPSRLVSGLARIARACRLPAGLRSQLGAKLEAMLTTPAQARAARRYFREPNNTVYGGVRINLAGREPKGVVQPEEVDALVERLTKDLLELVNVETGKPVVRGVERCDRWHRRQPTDAMPDLLLDWERSSPVSTVSSPKIGTVHIPYEEWRTGDHRPAGMLLVRGKDLPGGVRMPGLAVEDIGPSLAARLGVQLDNVDGQVSPWLAGAGVAAGAPVAP